jgi:hypothetical protein
MQALINAMADLVIPIFDGVNLHTVARALWYDDLKKASSLQLSGWALAQPLLEFPDGKALGDMLVEAVEFILQALAILGKIYPRALKKKRMQQDSPISS